MFGNPLKNYPYNEEFKVEEIQEEVALLYVPDYPMQKVKVKYIDGSWAVRRRRKGIRICSQQKW